MHRPETGILREAETLCVRHVEGDRQHGARKRRRALLARRRSSLHGNPFPHAGGVFDRDSVLDTRCSGERDDVVALRPEHGPMRPGAFIMEALHTPTTGRYSGGDFSQIRR